MEAIDCFHDPIMQHVFGGSLYKNNTTCLLLGLYHASMNWLSIFLMQIPPQNELYYGIGEKSEYMLFTGWEVRMGKSCARGLEYGPRLQPEGRTQDQGHSFFPYGPT